MILPEWTIAELQEKMESGELTSRRLAELYLGRIEAVDKSGPPYINAVIELNPDALEIADTLDAERRQGKRAVPAAWNSHSSSKIISILMTECKPPRVHRVGRQHC